MMKKSLKPLRQVNLFSGVPDRKRTSKPKKQVISRDKFERKLHSKNVIRNFLENQLMLPVLRSDPLHGQERILPIVPDEYLLQGFPDLVTKHRSFRVSDGLDIRLTPDQAKRDVHTETWNDHQIIASHSELLHESLAVLTYDGVLEEKIDVLEWIFANDLVVWHGRRVKAELVPFSFKACCMFCSCDYAIIRRFVYSKLPSDYKQFIDLDIAA